MDCYQLLPMLTNSGKLLTTLTAYQTCSVCVFGGGGGGGDAYLLTSEHFELKISTFASKLGDNVDCYQLLPMLTKSGKLLTTLTAYQTGPEYLCVGGRQLLAYQRAFSIEYFRNLSQSYIKFHKISNSSDFHRFFFQLTFYEISIL